MTFRQTYTQAQEDTVIITPSSGKKIFIWSIIIETENNAILDFLTSEILVYEKPNAGKIINHNVCKEGAINEVLSLTCGANTTIKILYDEVD